MTAAKDSIHVLMSKVMKDIGAIKKAEKNTQQNFVFRGIDAVMNAMHEPLTKHGVFYTPEVLEGETSEYVTSKGTAMRLVQLKVAYTFYGPQGDSVRVVTQGEASDAGDKATNKALAAALKYALLHTFCVPTEEEGQDDADRTSPELSPTEVAKPLPTWLKRLEKAYPAEAILAAAKSLSKGLDPPPPTETLADLIPMPAGLQKKLRDLLEEAAQNPPTPAESHQDEPTPEPAPPIGDSVVVLEKGCPEHVRWPEPTCAECIRFNLQPSLPEGGF